LNEDDKQITNDTNKENANNENATNENENNKNANNENITNENANNKTSSSDNEQEKPVMEIEAEKEKHMKDDNEVEKNQHTKEDNEKQITNNTNTENTNNENANNENNSSENAYNNGNNKAEIFVERFNILKSKLQELHEWQQKLLIERAEMWYVIENHTTSHKKLYTLEGPPTVRIKKHKTKETDDKNVSNDERLLEVLKYKLRVLLRKCRGVATWEKALFDFEVNISKHSVDDLRRAHHQLLQDVLEKWKKIVVCVDRARVVRTQIDQLVFFVVKVLRLVEMRKMGDGNEIKNDSNEQNYNKEHESNNISNDNNTGGSDDSEVGSSVLDKIKVLLSECKVATEQLNQFLENYERFRKGTWEEKRETMERKQETLEEEKKKKSEEKKSEIKQLRERYKQVKSLIKENRENSLNNELKLIRFQVLGQVEIENILQINQSPQAIAARECLLVEISLLSSQLELTSKNLMLERDNIKYKVKNFNLEHKSTRSGSQIKTLGDSAAIELKKNQEELKEQKELNEKLKAQLKSLLQKEKNAGTTNEDVSKLTQDLQKANEIIENERKKTAQKIQKAKSIIAKERRSVREKDEELKSVSEKLANLESQTAVQNHIPQPRTTRPNPNLKLRDRLKLGISKSKDNPQQHRGYLSVRSRQPSSRDTTDQATRTKSLDSKSAIRGRTTQQQHQNPRSRGTSPNPMGRLSRRNIPSSAPQSRSTSPNPRGRTTHKLPPRSRGASPSPAGRMISQPPFVASAPHSRGTSPTPVGRSTQKPNPRSTGNSPIPSRRTNLPTSRGRTTQQQQNPRSRGTSPTRRGRASQRTNPNSNPNPNPNPNNKLNSLNPPRSRGTSPNPRQQNATTQHPGSRGASPNIPRRTQRTKATTLTTLTSSQKLQQTNKPQTLEKIRKVATAEANNKPLGAIRSNQRSSSFSTLPLAETQGGKKQTIQSIDSAHASAPVLRSQSPFVPTDESDSLQHKLMLMLEEIKLGRQKKFPEKFKIQHISENNFLINSKKATLRLSPRQEHIVVRSGGGLKPLKDVITSYLAQVDARKEAAKKSEKSKEESKS